jgi:two-component system response regulator QseB
MTAGSARATRVAVRVVGGGQASGLSQLCARLLADGFVPETAPYRDDAPIEGSAEGRADAFLLVWSAPRRTAGAVDAVAAVRRLRTRGCVAPVLVIGEAAPPAYVATVLDAGADEYVRQPYDSVEVAARLRALVRRSCGLIRLGSEPEGLVLDRLRHVVMDREGEVALTPREAALLECLAQRAGRPVAREELAACVWGVDNLERTPTNIIDVYVAYLRRKLGNLGRSTLIRSVRGIGYELAVGSRPLRRGDAVVEQNEATDGVKAGPAITLGAPPPQGARK